MNKLFNLVLDQSLKLNENKLTCNFDPLRYILWF